MVELASVAVAARRCDVAVRTIRRWIDAGMVRGTMPTGSGRVRLVDVVSVANYIAARWTAPRTCEKSREVWGRDRAAGCPACEPRQPTMVYNRMQERPPSCGAGPLTDGRMMVTFTAPTRSRSSAWA